jgi:hypothetical protein
MSGINYTPSRDLKISQTIFTKSANANLALAESSSLLYCNNTSNITITIPAESSVNFSVGSQIDVIRSNSNVGIAGGSGIVVNSSAGTTPKIRVQWGACTLIKIAANSWTVIGDITTTPI